ncbi:MAG TPA: hypothetical protein VGO62_03895 [Myxococcota bacterium]|jgi:hypothetical protein
MTHDGAVALAVGLGVGIPVLVLGILAIVFSQVKKAAARARQALEHEGILLDSGKRWVTLHLRGYRAPGIAVGAGLQKLRCAVILTKKTLALIPGYRAFTRIHTNELSHYTVGVADDGALRIHSDDPPRASGSIDYRVPVDDASAWVRALVDMGAKSS